MVVDLGEHADQFSVLIRDRAGQFTAASDTVLADAGVTVCKIPPRSPRANAHAEQFVLTVRSEITDRMPILDQRHLHRTLGEYMPVTTTADDHTMPSSCSLHDPTDPSPTRPTSGSNAAQVNEYERAA